MRSGLTKIPFDPQISGRIMTSTIKCNMYRKVSDCEIESIQNHILHGN